MKCQFCDGRGAVQIAPNVKGLKRCPVCGGSGEVSQIEQTNEEWFCQLSTEEKAKFIFWQHFDVYGKTLYELMVIASKGVSRDKQAEVMIGAVVEWLKEKHDG